MLSATAGENGQCEYQFGGSSAATAMASGIIAFTLQAKWVVDVFTIPQFVKQ